MHSLADIGRPAACSATSPATRWTRASTRPSAGTSRTCRSLRIAQAEAHSVEHVGTLARGDLRRRARPGESELARRADSRRRARRRRPGLPCPAARRRRRASAWSRPRRGSAAGRRAAPRRPGCRPPSRVRIAATSSAARRRSLAVAVASRHRASRRPRPRRRRRPPRRCRPAEWVTACRRDTAARMACRIVVPPVVTSPLSPCQSIVQPPHWLPMSSALLPATWMRASAFASGSTSPSFFSSTSDLRTASRATARCSAEPNAACRLSVGQVRPVLVQQAHRGLDAQDARARRRRSATSAPGLRSRAP